MRSADWRTPTCSDSTGAGTRRSTGLVTVTAMKASGTKMRTLLRRALPPDATAPGLARRALGELPPRLGVDPADLRLMVSELVTNSVRHAQAAPSERIKLDIFEMEAGIHVEVRDLRRIFALGDDPWGTLIRSGHGRRTSGFGTGRTARPR